MKKQIEKKSRKCSKCKTPMKDNLCYDSCSIGEMSVYCRTCGDIKRTIPLLAHSNQTHRVRRQKGEEDIAYV